MEEALIAIFGKVIEMAGGETADDDIGRQIRAFLAEKGGIESLAEQCETVSAWHSDNDLPLLWPIHANTRTLLFRLLGLMEIRSTTQDTSLLDAMAVVVAHRHARRNDLKKEMDLGFASQRWQNFVIKNRTDNILDRRRLEVCVFIHLVDALQAGDLYVVGAENFGDYRTQLLSWPECEQRLAAYCDALRLPRSGDEFVI